MKRIKVLLFILLMVLAFNVKAAGSDNCDSTEFNRLKELAKKVEFNYEYKLVDEKAVFSITAYNLNEDLKVLIIKDYYNENYRQFKDNGSQQGTLDNFESGEKVTVTIKGYVPNWCSGKTITTKVIKLPYYNYYYDEEKCKGNEEFKYCKQLIDTNISQKEFDNQLAAFIKNKEKKNQTDDNTGEKDYSELIKIVGIGVGAAVVIGVVVVILLKRRKKNML